MNTWLTNRFKSGYTVVELAISTTIIALLAVGGLSLLEKKNSADNIRVTTERLDIINKALYGFIANSDNGYVPCPSQPSLRETELNFGKSESYDTTTGECGGGLINNSGAVPVRTLKLPLEYSYDGWGRKFTYVVSSKAGNFEDFRDKDFRGDLGVTDMLGTHKTALNRTPPDNKGAIYVLISHGANGRDAAYRRNDTATPVRANITGIEQQNIPGASSNIFIQDLISETFDDIVIFGLKSDILGDSFQATKSRFNDSLCYSASEISEDDTILDNYRNADSDRATVLQDSAKSLSDLCANLPSTSFAPSNVTGLEVWLDAGDIQGDGSKPSNNSPLTIWVNKAGLPDALANEGHAPEYISNAFSNLPGSTLPAILFNGSTSITLPALEDDLEKFTIFTVVIPNSNVGSQTILSQDLNNGIAEDDLLLGIHVNPIAATNPTDTERFGISLEQKIDNSINTINHTDTVDTGVPVILSTVYDGNTLQLFKNAKEVGNEVSKTNLKVSNDDGVNDDSRPWSIGRSPVSGHEHYWDGHISEVVIYNNAVSRRNQDRLYEYFSNKWGIPLEGNLSNNCRPGLVFRRTATNPEGACECEDPNHIYISSTTINNACIVDPEKRQEAAYGTCVEGNRAPTYNNPPPTTGMELWLDGFDCTSIVVGKTTNNVSQWRDKSASNNNHLQQTTPTSQPLYEYDTASVFGKPFIAFDGTDDVLTSISTDPDTASSTIAPETLFIVHNSTARSSQDYLLEFGNNIPNSALYNDFNLIDEIGDNWPSRYVNGSPHGTIFSSNWQIAVFKGQSINQDVLYLGDSKAGNMHLNGQIAEVIAYSINVNDVDRQQIETYLSQKWGIPIIQEQRCPGNINCDDLTLWLDANNPYDNSDIEPVDGSNVEKWIDRSGQNNHYDAITPASFESDVHSQVNSRPILHFSRGADTASGDLYDNTYSQNINSSAFTLFAALKVTDYEGSNRTIFSSHKEASSKNGYALRINASDRWELLVGDGGSTWNEVTSSDIAIINEMALLTAKITNGEQSLSVNQGSKTSTSYSYSRNTSGKSYIAGLLNSQGIDERIAADIGEIIIYDTVLNNSDTTAVENYLTAKWDIGNNCPGGTCRNLLLWFDADYSGSFTGNDDCTPSDVVGGGTIGCWRDRSGNDLHVKQTTAVRQPILVTNVLNNKPVVRFDGIDDTLTHTLSANKGGTGYTFFAVYKQITAEYDTLLFKANHFLTQQSNQKGNVGIGKTYQGSSGYFESEDGGWGYNRTINGSNNHHILTVTLPSGANGSIHFNGVEKSTDVRYKDVTLRNEFSLSGERGGPATFNGDIAEFVTYDTALTDSEISTIESYLGFKWGITIGQGPAGIVDGLEIWLNANDNSSLYTDTQCSEAATNGNNIACWTDRSINGNHVIAETNQPTYNESGFNSGRALVFDGTQSLTSLNESTITGNSEFTIFLAGQFDAASTTANAAFLGWGAAVAGEQVILGQNNLTIASLQAGFNGGGVSIDNANIDTDPKIVSWTRAANSNQRGENHHLFIDGIYQTYTKVGNHSSDVDIRAGYYLIGTAPTKINQSLQGKIAEVAIYDRVVTKAERHAIEAEFGTRWGITVYHTPGNVADGLRLWLDANDGSALYETSDCSAYNKPADGLGLACWMDKSTNSNNATQTEVDERPNITYSALNNRPVIQFNETDSIAPTTHAGVAPLTFFSVSQISAIDGTEFDYLFTQAPSNGANDNRVLQMFYYGNNGTPILYFGTNNDNFPSVILRGASTTVAQNVYDIMTGSVDSSGTFKLYKNGRIVDTYPDADIASDGTLEASLGVGWEGKLAEFAVYDSVLNTTDREAVELYLSSKWGVSLNNTPTPIPPILWLDGNNPDPTSGVKPADGTLTEWTDIMNSITLSQTTSSRQPTYDSDGLNNKGVVLFDGSDALESADKALPGLTSNAHSVFILAKSNDSSKTEDFLSLMHTVGSTTSKLFLQIRTDGGHNLFSGYRTPNASSTYAWNALDFDSHEAHWHSTAPNTYASSNYRVIAVLRDGTNHQIYINSTLRADASSASGTLNDSDQTICLGNYLCETGINGAYAEILMYDQTLTHSERTAIEEYLYNKWDLHPDNDYPGNNPKDLVIWYDGNDTDGDWVEASEDADEFDGKQLTIWKDKSRFNNHATPYNAAPTLSSSSLNSLSTVNFYRSGKQNMISNNTIDAVHAFIVGRFSDTTNSTVLAGFHSQSYRYLFGQGGSYFDIQTSNTASYMEPYSGGTDYHVFSARLTSNGEVRMDGADLAMSHTNYQTLSGRMYLGRQNLGGFNGHVDSLYALHGNIAEVVIYNSDIGVARRNSVESYLLNKWGIIGAGPPEVTDGSLLLWLDASSAKSVLTNPDCKTGSSPANGSLVACWLDLSGYANHAIQTNSTNRVKYVHGSDSYSINGKKTIRVDSGFKNLAITNALGTGSDATLYAVARRNQSNNSNYDFITGTTHLGWRTNQVKFGKAFGYAGNLMVDGASNTTSDPGLFVARTNSDGKYLRYYEYDGTFIESSNSTTMTIEAPFEMGHTPTTEFAGSIGEIRLYNAAHNDEEIDDVYHELLAKWGFYPALAEPGLHLWLDADTTVKNSLFADSSCKTEISLTNKENVVCWKDKSGYRNHFVRVNINNQPHYRDEEGYTIGSKSVVNFGEKAHQNDTEADHAIIDISFLKDSQYTLYGVVRRKTSTNNAYLFRESQVSGANQMLHFGWTNSGTFELGQSSNDFQLPTTYYNSVTPETNFVVGRLNSEGKHLRIYDYDGYLLSDSNTQTQTLVNAQKAYIGHWTNTTTKWSGDIAELRIYNIAHSDAEIDAKYETIGKDKWGFESSPSVLPEGLYLWLDATNADSFYSDTACTSLIATPSHGDTIKCWLDKSGKGNHMTTTNEPPTYANDSDSWLNGKGTVGFYSRYGLTNSNYLRNSDYTIYAATRRLSNSDTYFLKPNGTSGDNKALKLGWKGSNSFVLEHGGSLNNITLSGVSSYQASKKRSNFVVARFSSNSGKYLAVYNENGTVKSTTSSQSDPLTDAIKMEIGSNSTNGEEIAEIRIYNYAHTDEEIIDIYQSVAMNKWGFNSPKNGLQLWLDASDNTSVFQDTGCTTQSAVGTHARCWQDQSGNNNDLLVTDNTTAAYSGSIGELNTMTFLGGGYGTFSVPELSGATTTLYIVLRQIDGETNSDYQFLRGGSNFGMSWGYNSLYMRNFGMNKSHSTSGTTPCLAVGRMGSTGFLFNIYHYNRVARTFTNSGNTSKVASTSFTLGGYYSEFHGNIGEVRMYNIGHNNTEIDLYTTELMDKWGFQ